MALAVFKMVSKIQKTRIKSNTYMVWMEPTYGLGWSIWDIIFYRRQKVHLWKDCYSRNKNMVRTYFQNDSLSTGGTHLLKWQGPQAWKVDNGFYIHVMSSAHCCYIPHLHDMLPNPGRSIIFHGRKLGNQSSSQSLIGRLKLLLHIFEIDLFIFIIRDRTINIISNEFFLSSWGLDGWPFHFHYLG